MKKEQLQVIFFYKFKLDHKAAKVTHNISNTFGQGITNEQMVQHWFQKFWNGNESLEDEESHRHPLAVNNDELKVLVKVEPHNDSRDCYKVRCKYLTILDYLR